MNGLILRLRKLMRANKLLTVISVIVLYSMLIPFYYERIIGTDQVGINNELSRYSFPQLGIEFDGPPFTSVSRDSNVMKLENKLAAVEVDVLRSGKDNGVPWCRKLESKDGQKIECLRMFNEKLVVFRTDFRSYHMTVEKMAASATILNKK